MRGKTLVIMGLFNLLHGLTHIMQFIQSMLMVANIEWIDQIMESPVMSIIWVIFGIISIYLGWQDYKFHKNHQH
jgi:hypothetical protein